MFLWKTMLRLKSYHTYLYVYFIYIIICCIISMLTRYMYYWLHNTKRPQFMWDYSLNLSILMREGKEINKDSFSSGERKRKSPSLSPPAILVGRGCSVRNVYYLMRRLYVQVHLEWGHYTHRGCQARSSYNQYKKIFPKSRVAW